MKYGVEIIIYQVSFHYELKWNLKFFLESTHFNLITISMNLFNQLVIVIYDPVMEG